MAKADRSTRCSGTHWPRCRDRIYVTKTMGRYPPLNPTLRQQLEQIKPSIAGGLQYYPCAAKLINGEVLSCVYFAWDEAYIKSWGVYPETDRGNNWVRLQDVAEVGDSPCRLPAKFATKLYKHGESGMGYTIFTVVFSDLSRQAYGTGNAVDFIRYPDGKGPKDVLWVLPHKGRNAGALSCPTYYWCLYSQES
jgi:hypothetical protein